MKIPNTLEVLYEDNSIIVCYKPAGISSQTERGFDPDMVSILSNYLTSSPHSTIPYVGVIHRLDKPVCGVMVYAKNKSSASILSKQLAESSFSKHYYAIVHSNPIRIPDTSQSVMLSNYLIHDVKSNTSTVVDKSVNGAKEALLEYKILKNFTVNDIYGEDISLCLLDIHLLTGRHHQIRVQLSHAGMPILGDKKYGTDNLSLPLKYKKTGLALAAYNLSFSHPTTGKLLEFTRKPAGGLWAEVH